MPIRGILLLAWLVASLPVCFIRPFYGILLWFVIAFLSPQDSVAYWSTAASFPWAVAVAIPTLLGFVCYSRGWFSRIRGGVVLSMLVLWGWFTITSVISVNTPLFFHHAQDTWARWQAVSKMLLMTLVTIGLVDTFARLRALMLVIAGCFGLLVLKAVPFIIQTRGSARLFGPQYSSIGDNNDFGLALNMTLPIFFFLAQTESKPWLKRLFWLIFLATIPAIFCTYSRGALIGFAATLMMMILRSRQRAVLGGVVITAALLAFLFAPAAWKERMNPEQKLDSSAHARLNAWTFSWNLAQDYPITGGGFSTFTPELFQRYAPVVDDVQAHSVYFGVLAEHGFTGLALYLILVVVCFAKARRLTKDALYYEDQTVLHYTNMFRFSLVGFLVSGCFLSRAYFDYYFTMVAGLVILDRLARQCWEDSVKISGEALADPDQDEEAALPSYAAVPQIG